MIYHIENKMLFLKYCILLIWIRKITVYSFWQVPMTIILQIKDFDTNKEGQFLFSDFMCALYIFITKFILPPSSYA